MSAKFKKYVYPFIFSILGVASFLILEFFLSVTNVGLGGAAIVLLELILVIFVILPIYCSVYGKKILADEKRKFAFTFYNSTVITLFYLLPLCMEGETYLYSLILFSWSELWALLPLIKSKKRTKNINKAE